MSGWSFLTGGSIVQCNEEQKHHCWEGSGTGKEGHVQNEIKS